MSTAKTISFKGYVHKHPTHSYEQGNTNAIDGFTYTVFGFKTDESIAEVEVSFQLPEGFDPVSEAVNLLESRREKLRADFQMALNEINDQIGKLQAITCEVPA